MQQLRPLDLEEVTEEKGSLVPLSGSFDVFFV